MIFNYLLKSFKSLITLKLIMENKKLFLYLLFINDFERNLKSFDYCLKFKMGTLVQLERNHKLKNLF